MQASRRERGLLTFSTGRPPQGCPSEMVRDLVCAKSGCESARVSMLLEGQLFLNHAQLLWPPPVGRLSPEADLRTGWSGA